MLLSIIQGGRGSRTQTGKQVGEVYGIIADIQTADTITDVAVWSGFAIGVIAQKLESGLLSREMARSLTAAVKVIAETRYKQIKEARRQEAELKAMEEIAEQEKAAAAAGQAAGAAGRQEGSGTDEADA